MADFNALVAARNTAKINYEATHQTTSLARKAWKDGELAFGINEPNPRKQTVPVAPGPLPDMNVLAKSFSDALAAEKVAKTAFDAAELALNSEMNK